MKITVLIDTYDHEHFIEQAITSMLDRDVPLPDGVVSTAGPHRTEPDERGKTNMTLRRFLDCVRRPIHTLRLVSYKLYEMRHPDEPWISQGAIRFCDAHLKRDQAGLEWGSGRSTKWYAERLGRLLSIEFDPSWHDKVVREIKGYSNVECHFIPLDHPVDQPTVRDYDPVPPYVAVADEFPDSSLDFVVVDGHYRLACVQHVLPKIKPGGLLLIDNTDWSALPEWGVPPTWPVVHQSRNVMTETTIWRKPDSGQGPQ